MSPAEIDVLLWYHCRCEDHPRVKERASTDTADDYNRSTIRSFLDLGLIVYVPEAERDTRHPMIYLPTAKLHAYVNALQEVPMPVWKVDWKQLK